MRVIHAALGSGAITVRGVGTRSATLADSVEPRRASSTSKAAEVDALGYTTLLPIPPPATLAIAPAASSDAGFAPWQSAPRDLDLRGDSLHTAFVLARGNEPGAFEVLWCADTTTDGDRTTCVVVE